ncbi:hypothetical protein SAMN04487818_10233 [Actinokineospora terrae]|uniref:Uncharacterized protein n=1 Tax=Actinokineospora terrae TaxID=155974 RepID=A0A1H9M9C5_9PSEU|nr:hypothetical protein SAMN04487818_10233 [Actinokineospora terrae]
MDEHPLARWNGARRVWETPHRTVPCGHWAPYSATWPTSGMTRRGVAWPLPTSAPPHQRYRVIIAATPTDPTTPPRWTDFVHPPTRHTPDAHIHHDPGRVEPLPLDRGDPTTQPRRTRTPAADPTRLRRRQGQPPPTRQQRGPDAPLRGDSPAPHTDRRRQPRPVQHQPRLATPRGTDPDRRDPRWGRYAPAIQHWERVLGRAAPFPTITGRTGSPVLNPALSEWMMGLPEGHVTDVPGLSCVDQLQVIGGGVVPNKAPQRSSTSSHGSRRWHRTQVCAAVDQHFNTDGAFMPQSFDLGRPLPAASLVQRGHDMEKPRANSPTDVRRPVGARRFGLQRGPRPPLCDFARRTGERRGRRPTRSVRNRDSPPTREVTVPRTNHTPNVTLLRLGRPAEPR